MKRCVIYTRSASGTHHQTQAAALRRCAAERNWRVVADYYDVYVSGRLPSGGPAWQQVLGDASEMQPDILLIHDLSRLSRSMSVLLRHLFELRERGLSLVSVTEHLELHTS